MASTILISGGASGIGRKIAETFLADGAKVHVCDSSPAMVTEFTDQNPTATATLADITQPAEVNRVFDDFLSHHPELNVLINNAGVSGPIAHVEDIDPDDWDHCIAVDLNGTFYMTRRAVPLLRSAWLDRQYRFDCRIVWCATTIAVCSKQVGQDRPDENLGHGAWTRQHSCKCCLPGLRQRPAYRSCHRKGREKAQPASAGSTRRLSPAKLDADICVSRGNR